MAVKGIPVVIATNGKGIPVRPVTARAPLMTVATNGKGIPIVQTPRGTPFIVQGLEESLFALSSDDGSFLIDDDGQTMETYDGSNT